MEEDKEKLLEQSIILKNKHEEIKSEMFKLLDASSILDKQYKELEKKLYDVESEYVHLMKEIIE